MRLLVLIIPFLMTLAAHAQTYDGYLFAYFLGGDTGEQVYYALSTDGLKYKALNGSRPVVHAEEVSTSGGVRDPHILRTHHGSYYMTLTDLKTKAMGWQNTAMVLLRSKDLITWESSVVDIATEFPDQFGDVTRVWAPQTIYDDEKDSYLVYWSMLQPGGKDILYYAYANESFTALQTTPKVLLNHDAACIDGDIVKKDGRYYLFFKNEDQGEKGLLMASSSTLTSGYEVHDRYVDQSDWDVEGGCVFQLIDQSGYILMYDVYRRGQYEFCKTEDFITFEVIAGEMDFKPRHGTVIPITAEEMTRLQKQY
ncbi:glycoside hydrolase family 43 protein [Marinoscillum furvescens]|uniref:Glycosyl hydrolase family 43 n=1 Tax=Marinoscillum furvescens DSM 4134 TaxID=1122208 RepID=A0A3D9LHN1_MARFU|nr:glycoside hydrolase family 43 protein [Marinoscillum furvescens]REE05519.1 glycosyl hydrolase family 43 [Marinoscillum furvescens DSM 4134]